MGFVPDQESEVKLKFLKDCFKHSLLIFVVEVLHQRTHQRSSAVR